MCGIVGYIGPRQAAGLILEELLRLEYRGYDSAGIAVLDGRGLKIMKAARQALAARAARSPKTCRSGTIGIGHTRWATHGAPTDDNSHPHPDQSGQIAVIHNGIIENYGRLRDALKAGQQFQSETDTEVLAHLIGEFYQGAWKRP